MAVSEVIDPRNRPLYMKLGIREGMKVLVINSPDNFKSLLEPMAKKVKFLSEAKPNLEFIQLFVKTNLQLFDAIPSLKENLAKDGCMWVCFPKRSSGTITDITENKLRDFLVEEGLVDVKVVYIDKTWTGLKFVYPLKDR